MVMMVMIFSKDEKIYEYQNRNYFAIEVNKFLSLIDPF